ncbi:D-aminoacyl-tRNA deacylase [Pseudosulfitobacter pseudonitzschiae]|uniref:D-aminoacyl-tRNA deacylase n=1 Tax=Pseudosulfitobacter pseudonitzschiae TaxID=1402135 RepID=UPI001AFC49D6|nr:D-aminoacyl-tRNA deacylase [Pseudosulfitobacter pseudonitzschiae]MBM1813860.1 D-tyrosyl-tRNA(Tyr) deacylase [Pseudosulfitobacter pseudonitzschiae]MBM1830853.1 D-tyrosyl-tRNA(Tyr) deacylase [Pseudosulfitobacter pseudonitzschiae]MBM1835720.1 D-tyrosyl-tRNA(Tyr) deacylase [Pseudosulfitobacter pseudonitzschiae]MBM1840566.1 D-tyrosyl-tRNA(Tyr) deacylase [Pseudosulfitobacter pseudonitzschiae]MBM1845446.1 D-tyrosyl-tRNA(Tyr) deacylase [Pseudosulfitobacter pseudonitzschiae]
MRALLQRVTEASVHVDGVEVGATGPGLLILVCAMPEDDFDTARALAVKISKLRLFKDEAGKMNLSVLQTGGSALVVSQFTLAADTSRGNRPGFSGAARPDQAETLYLQFAQALRDLGIATQTGLFGADMAVSLTNDGPVTLWIDTAD